MRNQTNRQLADDVIGRLQDPRVTRTCIDWAMDVITTFEDLAVMHAQWRRHDLRVAHQGFAANRGIRPTTARAFMNGPVDAGGRELLAMAEAILVHVLDAGERLIATPLLVRRADLRGGPQPTRTRSLKALR